MEEKEKYIQYSNKKIKEISEKERADGKKIILLGGCFDVFHEGHVYFLQGARGVCSRYLINECKTNLEKLVTELSIIGEDNEKNKQEKTESALNIEKYVEFLENKISSFNPEKIQDANQKIQEVKNKVEEIKKYQFSLFVNILNDKRVRFYKGETRPAREAHRRVRVVAALEAVNYAFIHPETIKSSTLATAKILKPDFIVQSRSLSEEEKKKTIKYLGYAPMFVEFAKEFQPDTLHTTKILGTIKGIEEIEYRDVMKIHSELIKTYILTLKQEYKGLLEKDLQYLRSILHSPKKSEFFKKDSCKKRVKNIEDFLNSIKEKELEGKQELEEKFNEYADFLVNRENIWSNYPKIFEQMRAIYDKTNKELKKLKR